MQREKQSLNLIKVLLRLHPRLCNGHHCLSPAAAAENVSTKKFVKVRPFQHGNESKCEKIMFLRRNVGGKGWTAQRAETFGSADLLSTVALAACWSSKSQQMLRPTTWRRQCLQNHYTTRCWRWREIVIARWLGRVNTVTLGLWWRWQEMANDFEYQWKQGDVVSMEQPVPQLG